MDYKSRAQKPWTKEEENYLIFNWGVKSSEEIAEHLGRSTKACDVRVFRLTGSRSIKRGKWTQAAIAKDLGFCVKTVRKAAKYLRLRVKRAPKERTDSEAVERRPWDNSAWLLDEEQRDLLIEWLLRDRWMRTNQYTGCKKCGRSDIPHKGKGFCKKCHDRRRYESVVLKKRGKRSD
jgi:hypothetical protein